MRFTTTTLTLVMATLASSAVLNPAETYAKQLAEIKARIPAGFDNTITGGLKKRRPGCAACQWCGGCGPNQGQCCIPVCCGEEDVPRDMCDRLGLRWSDNC